MSGPSRLPPLTSPSLVHPPTPRERATAVLLFLATLLSVYWTYGTTWMGGDPFSEPEVARGSASFAVALMAILLAHEMGHYIVARRHGFALSLPYFLPVPLAFGTFGAIIRLRSLPRTRTALLEMGAAGPLAGLAVALVALWLGLPDTHAQSLVDVTSQLAQLVPPPPIEAPPPPPQWVVILETILSSPPLAWIFPPVVEGQVPMMILANPPLMDLVGTIQLGVAPGRYDELSPLAMAGWVGCLVTAINLLPIGQLDGGHIFNALFPRYALRVARVLVGCALLAGVVWPGWAVWGVLLLVMRAWHSLPVPETPPLSKRAQIVGGFAVAAFLLTFMPRPVQVESVALPPFDAGATP